MLGTQIRRDAPKAPGQRQAPSRAGLQADLGLWRMCRAASWKCSRARSGNSPLKSQEGLVLREPLRCPRTQASCSLPNLAQQVTHTCCLTAPPILARCGPPMRWALGPLRPATAVLCRESPCPSRSPSFGLGNSSEAVLLGPFSLEPCSTDTPSTRSALPDPFSLSRRSSSRSRVARVRPAPFQRPPAPASR